MTKSLSRLENAVVRALEAVHRAPYRRRLESGDVLGTVDMSKIAPLEVWMWKASGVLEFGILK